MAGTITAGRGARLLLAGGLVAAGLALAGGGAPPAGAVTVSPTCDAFLYNPDGTLPATPTFTGAALPALDVPSLGGGTVETGTAFEITSTGGPVALPASITSPVPAALAEVKNITLRFRITGAASLGAPALTGNSVNALASVAGDVLTLNMRGSTSGSWHGASGTHYFPGGATFTPPTVHLPVVAPAAPGTISGRLIGMELDAVVALAPGANTAAHVACPLDVAVGATTVVAPPPPPPGAPDAVNDTATTDKGQPVEVDVLANDVPDAQLPFDPGSLAVVADPAKGTATVTAGGITYTPAAGAVGVDSFRYRICSVVEGGEDEEPPVPCDEATVSVTIVDPDAPTTPTTGGSAPTTAAVPTTTAAAGARAGGQLPRTGGASPVLGALGLALVGAGALAWSSGRRRPAGTR